jgi:hypothetical protein
VREIASDKEAGAVVFPDEPLQFKRELASDNIPARLS